MIIKNILQTTLFPSNSIPYAVILPNTCRHTLFWLHGYKERSEQLLTHPIFEQLAETYETAVVFPDVPDSYYINQQWNQCYTEDFFVQELIPYMIDTYKLPSTRDSVSIAGISMDGFGSLLLGIHHPYLFGKIASISGAFIIDDLSIGNPEVIGSVANIGHFRNLFGDIPSLADDASRNPLQAVEILEDNRNLSPIFLTCGTEDLLYLRNIKLRNRLQTLGLDVSWTEAPGNHDWQFFTPAVSRTFEWLFGK